MRKVETNPTQAEEELLSVYNDYCYECGANGDDYSYDEETDQLVCNCPGCPFSDDMEDD